MTVRSIHADPPPLFKDGDCVAYNELVERGPGHGFPSPILPSPSTGSEILHLGFPVPRSFPARIPQRHGLGDCCQDRYSTARFMSTPLAQPTTRSAQHPGTSTQTLHSARRHATHTLRNHGVRRKCVVAERTHPSKLWRARDHRTSHPFRAVCRPRSCPARSRRRIRLARRGQSSGTPGRAEPQGRA